jgi:hypothetical protein
MTAQETEKTLLERINGRVIDKIYVPRDVQAVYDFNSLLLDTSVPIDDKANKALDKRIEALKAKIKASSDCITLRSVNVKERLAIGEHYNEFVEQLKADNPDTEPTKLKVPFKEQENTAIFLTAIVSVLTKDGETFHASDKPVEFWISYLEEILDSQGASYLRIMDKIEKMTITQEREQDIVENLDFLG